MPNMGEIDVGEVHLRPIAVIADIAQILYKNEDGEYNCEFNEDGKKKKGYIRGTTRDVYDLNDTRVINCTDLKLTLDDTVFRHDRFSKIVSKMAPDIFAHFKSAVDSLIVMTKYTAKEEGVTTYIREEGVTTYIREIAQLMATNSFTEESITRALEAKSYTIMQATHEAIISSNYAYPALDHAQFVFTFCPSKEFFPILSLLSPDNTEGADLVSKCFQTIPIRIQSKPTSLTGGQV